MKKAVAALFFGAVMAYFLITGCTAFNDAPLPIYPEAAAPNDASRAADAGCARAPVPSTAPTPDQGSGGSIDIVLAMHTLSLGLVDGGVAPDFGYDLDGVCTCKPDPSSCISPSDAGHCDGEEGRDDAVGQLLATVSGVIGDPAMYANDAVDGGVRGLLARIQNYNGQDNDDSVDFSLYRSPGTGTGAPDFTNPDQEWQVDRADTLKSGGDPYAAATSASGFVKDKQLVVQQLASSAIPFNTDTDVSLQAVSLTGTLSQDASGHWRIDRLLGVGRWRQNDAISALAHVQDPQNARQRICQNTFELTLLQSQVCGATDLVDNPNQDNKKQTCNAISTAVELEMVPAKLGALVDPVREDACDGITLPTCN